MAGPPIEQDFILDADGRQVMTMIDLITRKMGAIQTSVTEIVKQAAAGGKDFDKSLDATVKRLQKALGQMDTMIASRNQPGVQIKDLNANRALSQQTRQATEYAKELNTARNSAEALQAKIAKLNQTIATSGKSGGFASTADLDRVKRLEAASVALRKLDSQYEQLEAKARRLKGVDLSPQLNAVSGARDKLYSAAMDGRRTNLTPELNGLSDAQVTLAERITLARREEAAAIRSSAAARKELATLDAQSFKTATELDRARVQSAEKIRSLREQLKTASADERSSLLATLDVEKARGRQLQANSREIEAQARVEAGLGLKTTKALIPSQMRSDAQVYGSNTVLNGTKFEQRNAEKALAGANTDAERQAALRNLDIANARVAAAQRLVAEEEKELRLLNLETEAIRKNGLANDKSVAGRAAQSEVSNLGLYEAQAAAKLRVAAMQDRIGQGTLKEQENTRAVLALEEKKLALINGEVTAHERLLNTQAREAAQSERQAVAEKRKSIGGRIGTAAFNTALYSGVAAVGFGALNGMQEGLQFAIEFEDELVKLQAIANATGFQLQQLKGSIVEVGGSSRFSLIDLTKISQTLAQAGVSAGSMQEVLQSVTTLATASGSTPDEAVNLVTSALGAFQLQASETARVADLMTSALNRTKLTVGQVGQALQYVGATAFEQNISLETLLATVGAMAQAGIKSGSTIGTGLRQLFVDLQTPSKKLVEQLESVGLTIADVNIAVNGEQQVLAKLATSGFGATQAYAGLETRAAAAYLVLKNNRDVIDQLQVSFAENGAAALANERAMDSLSAQWQRFKNILAGGFAENLEAPMRVLQSLIKALADRQTEMEAAAGRIGNGSLGERQAAEGQIVGAINYAGASSLQLVADASADAIKVALNGFGLTTALGVRGLGDAWSEYTQYVAGANTATKDFATRLDESNQKVDNQTNKISEVDKEISRLITQHASLDGNTVRTTAETVTLTSKFEGLSGQLAQTTRDYDGLIAGMRAYNKEQRNTLVSDLNAQISIQGQQRDAARTTAIGLRSKIRGDSALMAQLTPREREALRAPQDVVNQGVIADAGERLKNDDLRNLVKELRTLRVATINSTTATAARNDALARTTNAGASLNDRAQAAEAGLRELGGLSGDERKQAAAATVKLAQGVLSEATRRISLAKGPDDKGLPTLRALQQSADATIKGVKAALEPTKAEKDEAKANAREAKQRTAAESKAPKATQADVDAVGAILGLKPGSGQRTAAEQDHLHAIGATPATSATSGHSRPGGAARDFPTGDVSQAQGEALAAAARKYFADQGIPVFVKYENGKGKGQGTGKHVHVNLLPGATKALKGENNLAQSAFDAQQDIDKSGTELDQSTFKRSIREIQRGTSDAVIDATGVLLTRLQSEIERDARAELAKNGIVRDNDPRLQARLAQVREQQAQLADEYQDAITQSLIATTELAVKSAQSAFDAAIAPQLAVLANAQSSATGLDTYSLQNKVPDYVRVVAGQRTAKANEDVQRARAANIPDLIAAKTASLAPVQARMDALGPNASGYAAAKAEVESLTAAITTLRTEQDALNASLNAGTQIPTTLAGAFATASEAYRATHLVVDDFNTLVIDNMGGALDQVSTGLTDMFTSILTGSQTALGAFAGFAKGMINYIQQIAAKAIAGKIFELLLNVGASFIGSKAAPSGGVTASQGLKGFQFQAPGLFTGGPAIEGLARGGEVTNGSNTHDSVTKRLARGEWVVNRKSVDSVGNGFMANLNRHGAKALAGMGTVPVIPPAAKQETAVYVVAPEQKPSMGPNDVLVAIQSDILSGGETKKLIKFVSQGG